MAQYSDEDEIWNYCGTTSLKKKRYFKGKKTAQLTISNQMHEDTADTQCIIIDSDENDDFSEKYITHPNQSESWKFFMDRSSQKSAIIANSKDTKAKKTLAAKSRKRQKAKDTLVTKNKIRTDKISNPLSTCDDPKIEISYSSNSLKNVFSPQKTTNGKRKSSEDVFPFNEADVHDQVTRFGSQEKRRFMRSEDESGNGTNICKTSKQYLENDNLFPDSSPSKDICQSDEDSKEASCDDFKSSHSPKIVNVIVLEEDFSDCDETATEIAGKENVSVIALSPAKDISEHEEKLSRECSDSEDSVSLDGLNNTLVSENFPLYNDTSHKDELERGDEDQLPGGFLSDTEHLPSIAITSQDADAAYETSTADTLVDCGNLSKTRKQASLYSFFKARPSTSSTASVASSSKSIYAGITSRPSMRSHQSVPTAGLNDNQNKHTDVKASPDISQRSGMNARGYRNKQCPFYKKIPGTSITVDAFKYGVIQGCQAYFLTHFHYDHYGGLTKKFSQPIYCSQITANLVESRLGVANKWINPLPLWKPFQVADATITLMEANHCPGAVIVLFETKDGSKILHTGDFRACPEMETYDILRGTIIHELYLDTTYCNPSYAFPCQRDVIDYVVDLVKKHVAEQPKTLVVCGAYTIGKEKIFIAIAKALNSKICVMNDKKKVLDCLEDKELKSRVTLNWSEGQVHVLPMGRLNQKSLFEHHERHADFTSIVAFQPTGWTHSSKAIGLDNLRPKWSGNGVTLYGVPYSEHSSFLELKRFVQFIQPKKILPTVNNGNPASRKSMEAIFKSWEEKKLGTSKGGSSSDRQFKMDSWIT